MAQNDISPYKALWENLNYSTVVNQEDIIDKANTLITSCSSDFGPTMGVVVNTQSSEFIWGGGQFVDLFNIKEKVFMNSVDFNSYFYFYPQQDFVFNIRCYSKFWNMYIKNSNIEDLEYYWEIRLNVEGKLKWSRVRMVLSPSDGRGGMPFPIGLITNITEIKLDNYLVFYAYNKRTQKILLKDKEWAFPVNMELLTEREREIIIMISEGYPTKQIADKLFISENTVKVHKQRIFKKLNAKNSIEMMREVSKKKLIDWP